MVQQLSATGAASWCRLEVLILIIVYQALLVSPFNLDTNIPIYKFGPKDSYFGYSVAEHIIKQKQLSSQSVPVLLVGAPRAKLDRIRTGALFKCDLSTRSRDCVQLYVDPDNSSLSDSIDKEDQWLGVTVKSQGEGGYVMVCAHRYVHKGRDFRWGNGICYSLSQHLDYSRAYEPCRGRLVNQAHEQFGFCQAGTSGEISKNYEILIGTPGPYTWRGTVFVNNIRYSIKDDKTWYMGPVIEGESPVSKYSYLGMSVASGDFLESGKPIIASGAPRSNGTGQVIFYSKDSGIDLKLRGMLTGEQLASSFGYSMTSLDCDGDKQADLAVGAPFHYSKNSGGAVYVYLSKNLRSARFDLFQRLTGKPESRFGFALANAGDLNKDKFDDLAVGAPYEKGGVVYIYLGGPDGVKTEPSQVIDALELPSPLNNNIRTLGYSLSGNLDMDRNSYPDLLVGAYESDAVLMFRSRPIIKIRTSVKGNMTQIDPNQIGCPEDPSSKAACFTVEPCFQFLEISNTMNTLSRFSLRYRIEAETFTGQKYYRVMFRDSLEETPNIVEKTVSLGTEYGYRREHCNRELIYLKDKQDIHNKVAFKLTYSLKQNKPALPREGDPLPDISDYPILDQEEAQRIFFAKFNKDCGPDDVCDSNLVLKAKLQKAAKRQGDNYTLTLADDNIVLDISLANKAEPAYDTFIVIEHSNLSYVGRKVSETDQVDCSPETKSKLRCSVGNPFKGKTDFHIRFNGNSMPEYERVFHIRVHVETSSNDVSPNDNQVEFYTEVRRKVELELSGVSDPVSVRFGGEIRGEEAMLYEDEIGNRVDHRYIVKNHGPLRAHNVVVTVKWPYQLQNNRELGKWILYIIAKPTVTGQLGDCDLEPRYINPRNFKNLRERYTYVEPTRKKREVQIRKTNDKDGHPQQVATLSCQSGARCVQIKCWIQSIDVNKTATIHIRSRLWNATFLEEFSHLAHVNVHSQGTIVLDPQSNVIQNEKDDSFTIQTQVFPDVIHKPPSPSWWWYLIGILVGLIILIFIIILLYKTGFFNRNKSGDYIQVDRNGDDH